MRFLQYTLWLRCFHADLRRGRAHVEFAGDDVGDEAGAVFLHVFGLAAGRFRLQRSLKTLNGNFPMAAGGHLIDSGLNIPNSQLNAGP